jgi:hypothetical protein
MPFEGLSDEGEGDADLDEESIEPLEDTGHFD